MKRESSLLIAESPLQVLPSLAKAIGLNEAIVLQQLHYWTNGKSGKEHGGRRWVYNTVAEWQEQFPFWSERTLARIFNSLKTKGLILSEALADNTWDRTMYYSINYNNLQECILPSCQDALGQLGRNDTDKLADSILPECQDGLGQLGSILYTETTQRLQQETTHKREGEDSNQWEPGYPEPLPPTPAPTRAKLQSEAKERREKAEALIRAFLSEADGVAIDAPVTEGYFSRYRSAAFSLLSVGATPESVRNAVKAQRQAWPSQRSLDLIFIEKEWPRLSAVKVASQAPKPTSEFTPEQLEEIRNRRREIEELKAKRMAARAQGQSQPDAFNWSTGGGLTN